MYNQEQEIDEQEEYSACCGAEIVMLDVCLECKEHCDIFVGDDDNNLKELEQ